MIKSSIGAMRQSLYWQEHVAATTRNPDQRKRCLAAADRLKAQIAAIEASNA